MLSVWRGWLIHDAASVPTPGPTVQGPKARLLRPAPRLQLTQAVGHCPDAALNPGWVGDAAIVNKVSDLALKVQSCLGVDEVHQPDAPPLVGGLSRRLGCLRCNWSRRYRQQHTHQQDGRPHAPNPLWRARLTIPRQPTHASTSQELSPDNLAASARPLVHPEDLAAVAALAGDHPDAEYLAAVAAFRGPSRSCPERLACPSRRSDPLSFPAYPALPPISASAPP